MMMVMEVVQCITKIIPHGSEACVYTIKKVFVFSYIHIYFHICKMPRSTSLTACKFKPTPVYIWYIYTRICVPVAASNFEYTYHIRNSSDINSVRISTHMLDIRPGTYRTILGFYSGMLLLLFSFTAIRIQSVTNFVSTLSFYK